MIGWIVLAIVVVSLTVLAVAARSVTRRLPGMRQAQAELQARVVDAERLQERLADLQGQSGQMRDRIALVQQRVGTIKARRAEKGQAAG